MIIVNDHTTTKLVFAYFGLLGFAQVYGGTLFVYNPMRPDLLKLPVCDADQYFERSDIYGMGFNAAAGNYKSSSFEILSTHGSCSCIGHKLVAYVEYPRILLVNV